MDAARPKRFSGANCVHDINMGAEPLQFNPHRMAKVSRGALISSHKKVAIVIEAGACFHLVSKWNVKTPDTND